MVRSHRYINLEGGHNSVDNTLKSSISTLSERGNPKNYLPDENFLRLDVTANFVHQPDMRRDVHTPGETLCVGVCEGVLGRDE